MRGLVKAALVLALAATATPAMAAEALPFANVEGWSIRYFEGSTACHMSKANFSDPEGISFSVAWDAQQDMAVTVFASNNDGKKKAENGTRMGIFLFVMDAEGNIKHTNNAWELPNGQVRINSGYTYYSGSFSGGSAFLDDVQKADAAAVSNGKGDFLSGFMLHGVRSAIPRLRQCAESQLRMWGAK